MIRKKLPLEDAKEVVRIATKKPCECLKCVRAALDTLNGQSEYM